MWFTKNGLVSSVEYSVVEQLKHGADAVMVVGSDPLASLPLSISRRLKDIPLILVDPCANLTSRVADVTIPCGVSGIEVGGLPSGWMAGKWTFVPLYREMDCLMKW